MEVQREQMPDSAHDAADAGRKGKPKQTNMEGEMTKRKLVIQTSVAGAGLAVIVLLGLTGSRGVRADDGDNEESKIQQGFAIAPVPLNLAGKNRALVGLGSYIVNAQADCNACHNQGPASEFIFGG